jgi:hypothetical protein
MLLSWEHSGFSVWAGEPIRPGDTERQEHVARYVTSAPVRLDAIERKDQGTIRVPILTRRNNLHPPPFTNEPGGSVSERWGGSLLRRCGQWRRATGKEHRFREPPTRFLVVTREHNTDMHDDRCDGCAIDET